MTETAVEANTYTVEQIKAEAANLLSWHDWELGGGRPVPKAISHAKTAKMLQQMLMDYSQVRAKVLDELAELHLPDHALAMGFDAGGGRCGAIREEFKAIIRALKDGA